MVPQAGDAKGKWGLWNCNCWRITSYSLWQSSTMVYDPQLEGIWVVICLFPLRCFSKLSALWEKSSVARKANLLKSEFFPVNKKMHLYLCSPVQCFMWNWGLTALCEKHLFVPQTVECPYRKLLLLHIRKLTLLSYNRRRMKAVAWHLMGPSVPGSSASLSGQPSP